jgi:alkylation response protein AidB-like acyl-CoA dehydrogenase
MRRATSAASWPKEYGGGELPQAFQAEATRAMRRHNGPIMLNAIGLNWTGPLLLDMGSEEHRKRFIRGILSAEDIWCQGFSEPENGSDLGNAQTRAVRDGDSFVINGSKIWTTLGRYARYMILLARTDPDASRKYDGLSFFLAPMKIAGVETRPIRKLTGEHGFTQTFFTDARIPANDLIGTEGGGWKVAMRTLEYERGARGGQAGGYVSVDTRRLRGSGPCAIHDARPGRRRWRIRPSATGCSILSWRSRARPSPPAAGHRPST